MSYLVAAETLRSNTGQWEAYEASGHCAILAGPGSGKTRVLTIKVARMLAEEVHSPEGVACVTYNTECAREIQARLDQLGVEDDRRVSVGTLHSFCLGQIIMPFGHLTPVEVPRDIRVAAAGVPERLLGEAMATLRIRKDPSQEIWPFNRFRRDTLVRTAEYGWTPGDGGFTDLAIEYECRMLAEGLLDFEAMISKAYEIVERCPWVRRCVAARFRVLVVDEYQDLGLAMHQMVAQLVFAGGMRLIAVGDPDQSIYGFQGARPELLRELAGRDDIQSVKLRLNYRSAASIVEASKIALSEERDYEAHRDGEGIVSFHECTGTFKAQAEFIAKDLVPRLLSRQSAGEIAVLFPRKYEGDDLEASIQAAGIGYVRLGANAAYPRSPLARLVEDFARWTCGGWERGDPRLSRLLHRWTNLLGVARPEDRRGYQLPLVRFLFASRGANGSAEDWLTQLDTIVFGYEDVRQKIAHAGEWENYEQIVDVVRPGGQLEGFTLPALAGQAGSPDHLNLITLHSSKGCEYRTVVIAGADAGKIPNARANIADAKAEARRVFYVGISRAKDEVHLVYSRRVAGDKFLQGPSPFVLELQAQLQARDQRGEAVDRLPATMGPSVWNACPECGAPSSQLKGSQSLDEKRDDGRFSIECVACGWKTEGEV